MTPLTWVTRAEKKLFFVGLSLSLGFIISSTPFAYGEQKPTPPPPASNPPVSAEAGKKLFTARGCVACHQIGKGDQPTGPDLKHVVHRRPDLKALKGWILNPNINSDNSVAKVLKADKASKPYKNSVMVVPPPPLTDAEASSLIEYLKTLPTSP